MPTTPAPARDHVSELLAKALDVFGDKGVATRWLVTPLRELGNQTPEAAVSSGGRSALEQALAVLGRIEYGVYS